VTDQAGRLPLVTAIEWLAATRRDDAVYRYVGMDGAERAVTRRWLGPAVVPDGRRTAGAQIGLGPRNSPEFVLGAVAAWKLGAVPVPVRWDVPDWELERAAALAASTDSWLATSVWTKRAQPSSEASSSLTLCSATSAITTRAPAQA
jgi:acyl-CoA synthetase (AMP-forming)/AMP-acid ligase II